LLRELPLLHTDTISLRRLHLATDLADQWRDFMVRKFHEALQRQLHFLRFEFQMKCHAVSF